MALMPDMVGYTCEEAIKTIESAGWQVIVHEAMTPKQQDKDGECRVIRQVQSDQFIEIVISYF